MIEMYDKAKVWEALQSGKSVYCVVFHSTTSLSRNVYDLRRWEIGTVVNVLKQWKDPQYSNNIKIFIEEDNNGGD